MKITELQLLDYMKQWVPEEDFSDTGVYYASMDTDAMADHLVGSGCINSKMCYDWAIPFEKEIEKRSKKFRKLSLKTQSKRIDSVFKDCLISECKTCNHVYFLYDGNEILYPELLKSCWKCPGKHMEVYLYGKHKETFPEQYKKT